MRGVGVGVPASPSALARCSSLAPEVIAGLNRRGNAKRHISKPQHCQRGAKLTARRGLNGIPCPPFARRTQRPR